MYPTRQLMRLAGRKALLRQDIAYSRARCAQTAARITRPLAWLDRAVAIWRRPSPLVRLAAVPLGLLLKRSLTPRLRGLAALLRWGPLALAMVRGLSHTRRRSRRD